MKIKLLIIILLSLGAFSLTATSVLAQDIENSLSVPGRIQRTGISFEIKDSEYLNISLQSTNEITITLESVPRTISLIIEASSVSVFTDLTLNNLEPNKTYYKYDNSYKNETILVSTSSGTYTFNQDLTRPHHVWFQEARGTIYISPDDCKNKDYVSWDEATSTCTLTKDLTESVEIAANNITLDCNNHKIIGVNAGYGVYLNSKSSVQIKNCSVSNFSYGIFFHISSAITLDNNIADSNYLGIFDASSNNSTIANNTASNNTGYGINLNGSRYVALTNNISSNNGFGIIISGQDNVFRNNRMFNNKYNFYANGGFDSDFDNDIDTTNTVDGRPIYYIKNAANQTYDSSTNAGTFYCILCDNVVVKDLTITKNNLGILFWKTHNSKIENVNATNNRIGIGLLFSDPDNPNQLINNTANSNDYSGIALIGSDNNVLSANTVNLNTNNGILLKLSDSNTLDNNILNSNYSKGIYLEEADSNIIDGNTVSNNQNGIELHWATNNVFINNNIINNLKGLYLWHPSVMNNQIYHNNFTNNSSQAHVYYAGPNNLFDNNYPDGGNYWSDYGGIDEKSGPNQDRPGSDGIGDVSYNISSYPSDPSVKDRYPFMEESGWEKPPVPSYNVAVILAEPSDKSFEPGHNKAYFEGIKDQVEDYYCENAFGKWNENTKTCEGGVFNLEIKIFDNDGANYKLANSQEYYGKNFRDMSVLPSDVQLKDRKYILTIGQDGNGRTIELPDENRTEKFVWDAINEADEDMDYNDYRGVIVIYRGYSDQQSKDCKNCLWTNHWSPEEWLDFSVVLLNSPTESIDNWIAVSENETKYAWAHELGHALGNILAGAPLEDLYPQKASRSYGGNVVDYLDVMGARTLLWGLIKDTVSYFSSFTKIKLNWLKEKVVGYDNYPIESLETMKHGDEVVRYNLPNNSYYLIEARTNNSQYSKWDTDLPNNPLIIYKVALKKVPVNGRTVIMDFINIAGTVGAKVFSHRLSPPPIPDPFDLPFEDSANKVLIEINNRIAEPDSFKIEAQISEYSPLRYIGAILRPQLSLLGKIWGAGAASRKQIGGTTRGGWIECPVSILGYEIHTYCELPILGWYWGEPSILYGILEGLPLILLILISFFFLLKFVVRKIIQKVKNKTVRNILKIIIFIIWGIIILLLIILAIRLCISPIFPTVPEPTRLWFTFQDLPAFWMILALSIISRFCIKKITWKIKNEDTIEKLQNASKIIKVIIILIAIILISKLLTFDAWGISYLNNPTVPRNVLYESFPADLDLHAYDNQGNHTGINYETGEYENHIPNAEASGDLVYDDEWIFVPEETNVRFAVSSKDIYEMLEAEPELKQLTDGIETYEVQAIHYDETSQRYESNIVTEQIIPGVEQNYSIAGTHEQTQIERIITVPSLIIEIETARQLNLIDNDGVKNSLIKKLNNAQKQIEKNKNQSAINILNAFMNEVEAQKGKHIESDFAELLIKDAQHLIETPQPLVSTGENEEFVNIIIATISAILSISGVFILRKNPFFKKVLRKS